MADHPMPMNVGLVELSDDGIEVLGQYTRDPEWHVAIVASQDTEAKAARMASLLDARLVETPTLDDLVECQRIVMGHKQALSHSMISTLRSRGIEVFIWNGDQATPRIDSSEIISQSSLEDQSSLEGKEGVPQEPEPEILSSDDLEIESFDAGGLDPEPEPMPEPDPEPEPEFHDTSAGEENESPETKAEPEPQKESMPAPVIQKVSRPSWSIPVNNESTELLELLKGVRDATQAQTASVMMPTEDGTALTLGATVGFEDRGENPAPQSSSGLAWDCFVAGAARWHEVVVPGFAEMTGAEQKRISASVPVASERHIIGVISINLDTFDQVSVEDLVERMEPFADLAARTVVKSADFRSLNAEECCQQLMQVVDRIMSFDENLAIRLQDAGDVIARALDGDCAHVLLVDAMGRRLEWVGQRQGMITGARRAVVDRGFLGWVLRQEIPQILEAVSKDGSERRANVYLPILSNHPCGLLFLENLRIGRFQRDELLHILENVGNLLGEMLNVVEGMGTQELMSDMKMRILDANAALEAVSGQERAHALLDLAIDLTAACTAMWIPSPDSRPVTMKPANAEIRRIISESLFSMDALVDLTAEHGAWSWGMGEAPSPKISNGVEMPSPVVAIQERGGPGALLVFFTETEAKVFAAQMPLESLFEVMSSITDLITLPEAA